MELPNKKYQVIYADPAWQIRYLKETKKGINDYDVPYDTMTDEEIMALPIKEIADENAILFMWTTDSHLKSALEVIEAWGFNYKTIGFIWNKKEKSGKQVCYMGIWTMKGSEICLLATKGKIHGQIKSHKVRQLVEAVRREHSQKPDIIKEKIIELMGDLPRIELFARNKTEGWDVWGNEVESDITL